LLIGIGFWIYFTQAIAPEINYITKTTQRGQRATITLSDGSIVRLNAESSITFPESFAQLETRDIQLIGEAFFDVARNESKPFKIKSGELLTTVLGTSFNINAYPEKESIAVTVATGKVRVEASDQQSINEGYSEPALSTDRLVEEEVLIPGQQAVFDKQTLNITKSEINLDKYLAWEKGIILMDNVTLEKATEILSRWYGATFSFENEAIKGCSIDGEFKNDRLTNILDNIKVLMDIDYQIKPDNKIIITGNSCN
ncbi:MAG: FecR domain-containing protein, partial [Bacteroidota bacterium]